MAMAGAKMNRADLTAEFQQLLVREAWLLDNGRLDEWLEMFADNVRYWMPVRTDLLRGKEDFARKHLIAHIDDDIAGLVTRVRRMQTGDTFTEEPPPRTRHLITNVLVVEGDETSAKVVSNFLLFRSHTTMEDILLIGCREDRWRRVNGRWQIEERLIVLDHKSVKVLSMLF